MSEAAPRPVSRNTLYTVNGTIHIATSEDTLVPLLGDRSNPVLPRQDMDIIHVADQYTEEWVNRMVTAVTRANGNHLVAQRNLDQVNNYVDRLKQAIHDVAEEKEWCDEYNEFADEWGLIPLDREYEVTVTFTIKARDEDDAAHLAEDATAISLDLESRPRFSAVEA